MEIFFTSGCLYLYLYLLYKAPVNTLWTWKRWKRDAGKGETPPVWGVCACSFLGASWVFHVEVHVHSHGGNVWLLVPWGLGLLCKVSEHLTVLSRIVFNLVPVNCHWGARFFWPVTGTDPHKGLLFLCLGLVWVLWVRCCHIGSLHHVCGTQCMRCVRVVFSIFSLFCYVVMGENIIIIALYNNIEDHSSVGEGWPPNLGNRNVTQAAQKDTSWQEHVAAHVFPRESWVEGCPTNS